MTARKYSRQRESIRLFLAGRKDHPTAEVIYDCLREEHPRISLGTVYRNLSLLADMGAIRRISTDGSPDHFDGDISDHSHFVCRRCGLVRDVVSDTLTQLTRQASGSIEGQVESYSLTFYGICPDCMKKQDE